MPMSEEEKQKNRERMRRNYAKKKEEKLKGKNKEPPTEETPPKETPTPTEEKPTEDDDITIEEYVKYLVEKETSKKKASPLTTSDQVHNSSSGSYSSLVYLLPVLLPFIKAGGELAMKYIGTPTPSEQSQQLSLSQLLPQ